MSSSRMLAHTFYRYLSMMAILFSNVGYFYHGFSPNSCAHYGYIAPAFKGMVDPIALRRRVPEAENFQSPRSWCLTQFWVYGVS